MTFGIAEAAGGFVIAIAFVQAAKAAAGAYATISRDFEDGKKKLQEASDLLKKYGSMLDRKEQIDATKNCKRLQKDQQGLQILRNSPRRFLPAVRASFQAFRINTALLKDGVLNQTMAPREVDCTSMRSFDMMYNKRWRREGRKWISKLPEPLSPILMA